MTKHFKERMVKRGVSKSDILSTYYFGTKVKSKNYDKVTRNLFYNKEERVILVASYPNDVLVTCFKFDDDASFNKKLNEYQTLNKNLECDSSFKHTLKNNRGDKIVWRDDLENFFQLKRN